MTKDQFERKLAHSDATGIAPVPLAALFWDKKGEWDRAHGMVQSLSTELGMAVHAYLHREEGDLGNAGYWYSRAGRQRPEMSLADEWDTLVEELCTG